MFSPKEADVKYQYHLIEEIKMLQMWSFQFTWNSFFKFTDSFFLETFEDNLITLNLI